MSCLVYIIPFKPDNDSESWYFHSLRQSMQAEAHETVCLGNGRSLVPKTMFCPPEEKHGSNGKLQTSALDRLKSLCLSGANLVAYGLAVRGGRCIATPKST